MVFWGKTNSFPAILWFSHELPTAGKEFVFPQNTTPWEVQAKKAAKTAQKVQVNYGYGEIKRKPVAGNSNSEKILNCET